MTTATIILIVVLIIVAIPLIAALFVKKDYQVQREMIINRPQREVFDYVKMLKNHDSFSKWARMDPNMEKQYTGTDGAPGFFSAWSSQNKNVGKGEQEIKKITDNERIDFEIRFIKPFKSRSDAYMITEAVAPGQTNVKWGFTGSMPYPMNLIQVFMNMDKAVGDDFHTGLSNLKEILEKKG